MGVPTAFTIDNTNGNTAGNVTLTPSWGRARIKIESLTFSYTSPTGTAPDGAVNVKDTDTDGTLLYTCAVTDLGAGPLTTPVYGLRGNPVFIEVTAGGGDTVGDLCGTYSEVINR